MALFDLSRMFKGQGPSPDAGWSSGTTVNPAGAFFSQGLDGSIAGISGDGMKAIGRGLQGAAAQMPNGGAFAPSQGTADVPTAQPGQDWNALIASWRKRMGG